MHGAWLRGSLEAEVQSTCCTLTCALQQNTNCLEEDVFFKKLAQYCYSLSKHYAHSNGSTRGGTFFSYFHEGAINISGSPELIDGH